MAPKNKYTKEEMISAALRVVRAKGMEALTAKALAEELGTSTQPVFTCFSTMESVKKEVRAAAEEVYDAYVAQGLRQEISFYGFGTQYVRFAREEPELYRLLFLTREDGACGALEAMKHSQQRVRPSLEKTYHLSPEEADRFFRDLWLVAHSFATLIVTGGCPYSDEEIGRILTGFSVSICKAIKEVPCFTAGTFDRNRVFRSLIASNENSREQQL